MAYILLLPTPRVEVSAKNSHREESLWPEKCRDSSRNARYDWVSLGQRWSSPSLQSLTEYQQLDFTLQVKTKKRKANKSKCPGSTRTADLDRSCCPREKFLFPAFSNPVKKNIWPTPPKVRQPSEVLCPIIQCSVFLLPLTSTTNWRKLQNGRELPKLQMGGKKNSERHNSRKKNHLKIF